MALRLITKYLFAPSWKPFLLNFLIYLVLFIVINKMHAVNGIVIPNAECMRSGDDFRNIQSSLHELTKTIPEILAENARLQEQVSLLTQETNELKTVINDLLVDRDITQFQHEGAIEKLESERSFGAQQEVIREGERARISSEMQENQNIMYAQHRALQFSLDDAHATIGEMAGTNVELHSDAAVHKQEYDAYKTSSTTEKKQLESAISKLRAESKKR